MYVDTQTSVSSIKKTRSRTNKKYGITFKPFFVKRSVFSKNCSEKKETINYFGTFNEQLLHRLCICNILIINIVALHT